MSEEIKNVLIIDGSYLQIGIKELCQQTDKRFSILQEKKMRQLLQGIETVIKRRLDKVIFVSAEDYDGVERNKSFFMKLQKIGVEIDIRDYKNKTVTCKDCGKGSKQRVQAEVDVAIGIKLIDYSMLPKLTDIFLIAGDRDFIDAIRYCRHVLKKQITIIGFK